MPCAETLRKGTAATRRAVALDPTLAEARAFYGVNADLNCTLSPTEIAHSGVASPGVKAQASCRLGRRARGGGDLAGRVRRRKRQGTGARLPEGVAPGVKLCAGIEGRVQYAGVLSPHGRRRWTTPALALFLALSRQSLETDLDDPKPGRRLEWHSDAMKLEARGCGSPMPRGELIAKPAERDTRLGGLFLLAAAGARRGVPQEESSPNRGTGGFGRPSPPLPSLPSGAPQRRRRK